MSGPHSFSIVPSLVTPPVTPARLRWQLVLVGAGITCVIGLFILLGAPFVLALPGIDAEALVRLTAAQGLVVIASLLLVTQRGVRRMEPIHRTLLLGPRNEPIGPAPPLDAVTAAFRFHRVRPGAGLGSVGLGAQRRRFADDRDHRCRLDAIDRALSAHTLALARASSPQRRVARGR